MEITHLEIRAALHGAAFPATGDDLASVARVNQAEPEIVELLERLGSDDEFGTIEEVLDELNLDHTALENTTELRVALGMEHTGSIPTV
ncbi:MAG: DUF2795 domain-containing protein [Nitriliruptorales bacterium]|nr:DUF2795 domain-containing protein [Nitriliruptorales bacterium]